MGWGEVVLTLYENLADRSDPEHLYMGDEPLEEVDFTEEKVKKKLSALQPSAASGPDGVWSRILFQLADTLSRPLAIIFSKLFHEGMVPAIWWKAHVCPVYKASVIDLCSLQSDGESDRR